MKRGMRSGYRKSADVKKAVVTFTEEFEYPTTDEQEKAFGEKWDLSSK